MKRFTDALGALAEKCGWANFTIVRSLEGAHFQQLEYEHPFCNRRGRFYAGDEGQGRRNYRAEVVPWLWLSS